MRLSWTDVTYNECTSRERWSIFFRRRLFSWCRRSFFETQSRSWYSTLVKYWNEQVLQDLNARKPRQYWAAITFRQVQSSTMCMHISVAWQDTVATGTHFFLAFPRQTSRLAVLYHALLSLPRFQLETPKKNNIVLLLGSGYDATVRNCIINEYS